MMFRVKRSWLAALVAVGAMAGCSNSLEERPGYDDLRGEFDDMLEDGADLDITDPTSLPASGGATYDGVMGLSTDGTDGVPEDMAGEMTLRADFGSDSLSGSVGNVATSDNESLDGSLAVTGGAIDRDADFESGDFDTYDFDLDGTLTTDDGTDLEVDAVGRGDFLGDDYRQSTGIVEGVISSDEGKAVMDGGYVVER